MGFELPDGKTARNLQDQVKFLSEKLKDLYAAFNDSGLKKIEIVEELPEVGDPTTLYLLANDDPEEGDYYDEYLWIDDAWEQIGSTQIDLSDYMTLSTEQTATALKTFNSGIITTKIDSTDAAYIDIALAGTTAYRVGGADIRPISNNTKNIGTSDYKWKNLYLNDTLYLRNFNITVASSDGLLCSTNWLVNGNLRPYTNNAKDLGSSTYTWKDLYLSGLIKTPNGFEFGEFSSTTWILRKGNVNITFGDTSATYLETSIYPKSNVSCDLGNASRKWRSLFLGGQLKDGNNNDYGLTLPDTTSWTANKVISTLHLYKHKITQTGTTEELVIVNTNPNALGLSDLFNAANGFVSATVIYTYWNTPMIGYTTGGLYINIHYLNTSGTMTSFSLTDGLFTDTVSEL